MGLNQSLQTTQIKFDPDDGINLLDWVRTYASRKQKGENTAYHNLLLFQQFFLRFLRRGR